MFFVALERERERKHRSVVHSKQREKKERRTKRTVTLPDFPERESNRFLLLFSSMIFGRRSSTPNSSSGFVRFFVFAILLLSATERKGKRNGHIFTSKRGDFSPRCDVIKKNAHLFTHTQHTLSRKKNGNPRSSRILRFCRCVHVVDFEREESSFFVFFFFFERQRSHQMVCDTSFSPGAYLLEDDDEEEQQRRSRGTERGCRA